MRHGAFALALVLAAFLGIGASAAVAAPPAVTIEPASEIGVTSALGKGEVNPEEKETNCHFDYIADSQFGQNPAEPFEGAAQAPCTGNPLNGNTALPAEAVLTGLIPATTYHLRLVAENNEGESSNETAPTFETDAATAPTAAVTGTSDVSYTWAELEGTVNPNGGNANPGGGPLPIGWNLQYAPESESEPRNWQNVNLFNSPTPDPIEGLQAGGSTPLPVEVLAANLQPATGYVFRTVATYAGGLEAISATQGSFTTLAVAKPTVSVDPVTTSTDSTATFVGHVDPNAPEAEGSTSPAEQAAFETSWHFECVAPGPSCGNLSGAVVPAGNTAKVVEADATGLEPNKAYYVVLVASNLGGTEEATTPGNPPGPSFTTGALAPSIKALDAGPIQPEAADLNGEVDPHNSPTTYWFEWGTQNCETGSCTALPAGKDAAAGEGPYFTYATQHLAGLSPSTTYHFRLVAENASGRTEGADQTFTTASPEPACANAGQLGTGFLPDCRAWEMVSPPEKSGADVIQQTTKTHVAADGNAATFSVNGGGFGEHQGSSFDSEFISRRTGAPGTNGWTTSGINPPGGSDTILGFLNGNTPTYVDAFTPDLTAAVYQTWRPLTPGSNTADVANLYRVDGLGTAALTPHLLTDAVAPLPHFQAPGPDPETFKKSKFRPAFVGASTDLSHVVWESRVPHTADTPPLSGLCELLGLGCPSRLFENDNGTVRLVGRVPAPGQAECDDQGAPACEAAPSSQAGIAAAPDLHYSTRMVSADGRRILFQTPAGEESGNIYLREDGHRTYQLNLSESEPGAEPKPAQLWEASRDGSRVFFTTSASLLTADTDSNPDLYMYEVGKPAGHRLTLISASTVNDGNVATVVGASDDGHYVYFVADGQLVPGEPSVDLNGLYLWHDGTLAYIGQLVDRGEAKLNSPRTAYSFVSEMKTSRVSPDGRHLLFMTQSDEGFAGRGGFPGYDHQHHQELYLYSADSGRLACATCDPSGKPASADALLNVREGAGVSGLTSKLSHALADDGRYVFFSSAQALVPEDTNSASDAYSYDSRTGALHLISSGTESSASYFIDASNDGSDAFFVTRRPLSGWDTDTSYDLYDARIDGGLPEPAPVPAACAGESCLPASKAGPPAPTATSKATGPGNPKPPACRKGTHRVRRHGKAVCLKNGPAKKHHGKHHRKARADGRNAK